MSLILVDRLTVCGGGSRSEGEGGHCASASLRRGGATDNDGNRANSIRIHSSEAEDCAFACGNSLSVNSGASGAGYSGGGGVTHGAEAEEGTSKREEGASQREEGTSKREEGTSKRAHLFGGPSKVPRHVLGNTLGDAGVCGGGGHALGGGGGRVFVDVPAFVFSARFDCVGEFAGDYGFQYSCHAALV